MRKLINKLRKIYNKSDLYTMQSCLENGSVKYG